MRNADYWIEELALTTHPEGGYFRENYRSGEIIPAGALPERYDGGRAFSTSIFFLLKGNQVSRFHRLKSDELWHFYAGSSLTIHVIDPSGVYFQIRLGTDVDCGMVLQAVVERGCWFGAAVDDPTSYTLSGCTVAPGFDYDDFELGQRDELLDLYPEHRQIIEKLTA